MEDKNLQGCIANIDTGSQFEVKVFKDSEFALTLPVEGKTLSFENEKAMRILVKLMEEKCLSVKKNVLQCFLGLSLENNASILIKLLNKYNLLNQFWDNIFRNLTLVSDPNFLTIASISIAILSNLSRIKSIADELMTLSNESDWKTVISYILDNKQTWENENSLNDIGHLLCNMSQSDKFRNILMSGKNSYFENLLSLIHPKIHKNMRQAIVGMARNCCFDTEYHDFLLSDEVDVLSHLLLPLAGPEDFDDDDMQKLPMNLQYLPPSKERETEPSIRLMLIEALIQLCAKRQSREYMRKQNIYVILREFHKWEQESTILDTCEDLVNFLIRTEDEIGIENLKEVHIPDDIVEKIKKLDSNKTTDV